MQNRNHPVPMFLILCITLLAACGTKTISTPGAGTVPNSLVTIEAAAEDIIDFAPSGNWDKIGQDVTDIESAWKSYEPQAGIDGASPELQTAMNTAVSELETASSSKDASATMQGSNDVSAAVVELFALYNPNIPADIGRLDVLERQVILDVAAGDYAAAQTSLSRTKSVWEQVQPSILGHDGKDTAAQFESTLAAQESALEAKDAKRLTNEARAGLEIVDALESLY